MRRVAFAIISTIAGLVGLLSFKTHPTSLAASSTGVTATGPVGSVSGSSGSGSGTAGSSHAHRSGAGTSTGGNSTGTTKKSATSSTKSSSTNNSSTNNSSTNNSSARKNSPTTSTKTVTGAAVETPYGPIQVRIRVANGKIANAAVVQYPSQDSRSQQLSYYAIPMLERESEGQSSANIDMVSGATYTSEGYLQSLQSALNKAGL